MWITIKRKTFLYNPLYFGGDGVVCCFHCFVILCCLYFLFPFRCRLVFDYGYKVTTFFRIYKFFLTFLYKMFWKWYYKCFSVWVKIIAYNCIIILCHLVEVAIFAVGDFFSLFGIAVFNIPISHIIVVLLFLLQSYCFFRYFQTFFNFFHFFRLDLPAIAKFVLPVFLPFSVLSRVLVVFRRCAGRVS